MVAQAEHDAGHNGTRAPGLPSLVGHDLSVRLVSYAQNAEDVRLWRVLSTVDDGFYVDVGAHEPVAGSVTKLFYDAGWHGVNLEPGPTFAALAAARPRDINLEVVIGPEAGEVEFWVAHPQPGLSTLTPGVHAHVPELIERYEAVTVPSVRLETVLDEHARREVHFLKIDVEGAEAGVIASNDWTRHRPWVVVVEAVATMDSSPTHDAWEPALLGAGYQFAAFDGLNRFYVSDEHADLAAGLAYPIGVLDHFVTGAQLELEGAVAQLRAEAAAAAAVRADLEARLAALEAENARLQADADQLRGRLHTVMHSGTWRAGRAVWAITRPAAGLARRLRPKAP